jgi:hypothetical protein
MALIGGGALAAGCVDASEPAPATGTVAHTLVSQPAPASLAPTASLRVTGQALSLDSAGFTQAAPGVWQSTTGGSVNRIVVGAEGHRAAIASTERELAALRADGSDAALAQIESKQAYLATLHSAAAQIAAQAAPPPPLSCNIGFVIGPSSPIVGVVGAFAGVVLSCVDGNQLFTVQAQACTDFGCGPVATFTPTIIGGAAPLLFGTATAGTLGAACFGVAAVTPPGVSSSASGPCG